MDDGHEGVETKKGERPAFLEPLAVPVTELGDILHHVHFLQTKFFEIDDDLVDKHIPWPEIVDVLQDGGWTGWLSSEYEGRREPNRGRDQVRSHHVLLRSLACDRTVAAEPTGHDRILARCATDTGAHRRCHHQ